MEELSDPQRSTLKEIRRFINQRGFPPTMKELADILGISHASAHGQVNQLVRKGYLKREPRKARGIAIVREAEDLVSDLVAVPIVGLVAAGRPILAEENIIGEVLVEASTIRSGKYFALQTSGESMIGAGIGDGDLIIVRRQPIAENGDIVVALVNGEATVKRLKIKDDLIELVPENPGMKPIHIKPEDDLLVLGKVVGWKRKG